MMPLLPQHLCNDKFPVLLRRRCWITRLVSTLVAVPAGGSNVCAGIRTAILAGHKMLCGAPQGFGYPPG
jgi:hypothetical protein